MSFARFTSVCWLFWFCQVAVARVVAQDASTPAAPAAIDVKVEGSSDAERQRQSAEAVKVVETRDARREAADLGAVLARTEGVSVRRIGGLGAGTRLSINGLSDDQIRFYLDGVPLELSGYSFGLANVPVGVVERIDVQRGVVPIRYGGDALGGVVDLITDQELRRSHATGSFQIGSFGTQRLSGTGVYAHTPTGVFARLSGFLDRADNDYLIDVEVADEKQRKVPGRVHRHNDHYRAHGVSAEVGVARRPWAKLLALRTFFAGYDKGLPHDVVMETPYGRVRYGSQTRGASLRLDKALFTGLQLQATLGYAHDQRYFKDTSTGIFDWYGRRTGTRTVGDTITRGEIKARGYDQNLVQHSGYARAQLSWRFVEGQALRLALSPTYATRTGEDRQIPDGSRDALDAQQNLWVIVTGLEHRLDAFDGLLDNSLFVKDYIYRAHSDEPRYGGVSERRTVDFHRTGVGDALRLRVNEDLYLKASYEWTTRLPRADEVFGDGMRVSANLDLLPETSHNANLSATFAHPSERWGSYRADATLFLRDADRLITRLPDFDRAQTFYKYQNIYHARSVGVEAAAGWTSPGEFFLLDVNVTWQDFRNVSEEGAAARYKGDAIPNRPWLFGNGTARLRKRGMFTAEDTLTFSWYGRYVHEFFRSWESAGALASKAVVDAQFLHTLLLTYVVRGPRWTFSSTIEVQNVTDAKAFDFYGVQLPGRAAYYNATLEL